MGISPLTGQTYGSTNGNYFARPQHTVNVDGNHFRTDRRQHPRLQVRRRLAPDRHLLADDSTPATASSPTRTRPPTSAAAIYREGAGTNRASYINFYVGDTIAFGRLTLDLGVRYDRQWGEALASQTAANAAFPNLVPGISFAGYEAPFHWNDITPRVGVTYALDEDAQDVFRASFSRNAGQLTSVGTYIGYSNPSSAAGWVEYPWVDAQRRPPGADQRSAGQPAAARLGRRLQHREPDGGDVGQPDRSGLQGARRARASSSASIAS